MQYFKYPPNKYQYWTLSDGRKVREGQDANGYFVTDIELYVGGFADAIDVGWESPSPKIGTLTGNYYKGIKDCAVVLLVGTNPNGAEGIDYEYL